MASVACAAMSPSRISNVNSGRIKEVTLALAIARQDVVGQREQRVALGAWRKRVERRLGDLGELRRAPIRVVDRPVMFKDAQQLAPRAGLHGAVADDLTDDACARFVALLQQVNQRQRHLAFAQIATNRFSERRSVTGEIQQVVSELKRDAEV